MTADLVPAAPDASALVAAFLGRQTPATRCAYSKDLVFFAAFLGVPGVSDAARTLISGGRGAANLLVLRWMEEMGAKGLSSATIARRMSAVRSLVSLARTLGLCEWALEVRAPKKRPVRDVRGPTWRAYLAALPKLSARDRAVCRLMGNLGLRRAEVVSLTLADVDVPAQRVLVRRKGGELEGKTVPPETLADVASWIAQRGPEPGPLFPGVSADAVYRIVRKAGLLRPHALRHASITRSGVVTNGNVGKMMKHAGHKDPAVTMGYVDELEDVAGQVARKMETWPAAQETRVEEE